MMNTPTSSVNAFTDSVLDNYVSVLKKYSDFNSRARRSEYWYFFLVNIVVTQALSFANVYLFGQSVLVASLVMIFSMAVLVPSVTLAIRRMHDVGKSGWYALIPIYGLVLACTEGVKGTNEYGPDPKLTPVAKSTL